MDVDVPVHRSSGYASVYLVHLELKASSETDECEREPGHLTDRFLKSLCSCNKHIASNNSQ